MVTGELPEGQMDKFGIAIVDTNLTSKQGIDGVTGYTIVDSEIPTGDRQGTFHGRIEWGEIAIGVTADILADGDGMARGGRQSTRLMEVAEIMLEMFEQKDTWRSSEVLEALKEAGVSTRKDHLLRAREQLGIRSLAIREKGKAGIQGWRWTTRKASVREEDDDG
jgi:hypothetical protein